MSVTLFSKTSYLFKSRAGLCLRSNATYSCHDDVHHYSYYLDITSASVLMFPCSITFKSNENKTIVNRLVREVKGLNPEFKSEHIQGSVSFVTEKI